MTVDRSPKDYYTHKTADIPMLWGSPTQCSERESPQSVLGTLDAKSSVSRCSKWSTVSNATERLSKITTKLPLDLKPSLL